MKITNKHLILALVAYWISPVSFLPANLIDELLATYFVYKKIQNLLKEVKKNG